MYVTHEAQRDSLNANKKEVMDQCESIPSPTDHNKETVSLEIKNNDSRLKLSKINSIFNFI